MVPFGAAGWGYCFLLPRRGYFAVFLARVVSFVGDFRPVLTINGWEISKKLKKFHFF